MANLQLYTLASVYIDGALLTEESDVKVSRDTGAQKVLTVQKGFAGLSPGAPMMTVEVSSAVPSADFEMNPGKYMKALSIAEITIFAAGRTLTVKGFITKDDFSHAVNKESTLSFTFEAPYAEWV